MSDHLPEKTVLDRTRRIVFRGSYPQCLDFIRANRFSLTLQDLRLERSEPFCVSAVQVSDNLEEESDAQ